MAKASGGKYRVGVLGCGGTSGHFFMGFGAWPERSQVAAICDIAPRQMTRAKEAYGKVCGDATEYTDYHRMLKEANLDIVCICSYSDKHMEHASDCLAAGKHVFVEKPVGYDLEEARRLRYLASKYPDLKVQVAYSLRYYKAFMDLQAVVRKGVLGDILTAEISYSHGHGVPGQAAGREEADAGAAGGRSATAVEAASAPSPGTPGEGRGEGRRRGNPFEDRGGNYKRSSQLVHATHPWDLARYMLGEVKEVFCATGNGDMGILWMKSGAICHVLAGSVRHANVGYMQNQIVCVNGQLGSGWVHRETVEPYRWLATYKTDGDLQPCPQATELPESSHGATIRTGNLLDAIEGKAELICSLEDGIKTTELLHALWLSQRMQVKVPVLSANVTG